MAKSTDPVGLNSYSTSARKVLNTDGDLITEIYEDSTYVYVCKAVIGTSLSDSKWRVIRIEDSSGNKRIAEGADFNNPATNLTTVQALTYV